MPRLKGFSLVEVIISGALVATTVGALFAASSMAVRLTASGQDRLIGANLAREGIEVVRQIRDTNFFDCAQGETDCHTSWATGLLATGESLPLSSPLPKRVTVEAAGRRAYTLSTVTDVQASCTDYLVRSTQSGEGGIVVADVSTSQGAGLQLFCRRIIIEPVQTNELQQDSVRVRSQVAWLGYGKNSLRTLGEVMNSPECPGVGTNIDATEWCTEQVTLLTNWRTQL